MTRITAAQNAAAIADLNLRFDRLEALIVGMTAEQPAKTVRKAPAKKAPAKTAQAKSNRLAGGKGPAVEGFIAMTAPAKALCKSTRVAFIAAAKGAGTDFSGMSTKAIAAMCIEDASLVPAGFRIGEGYTALLG